MIWKRLNFDVCISGRIELDFDTGFAWLHALSYCHAIFYAGAMRTFSLYINVIRSDYSER
jgi:hypothetical protein